jgi:hypothetical protein
VDFGGEVRWCSEGTMSRKYRGGIRDYAVVIVDFGGEVRWCSEGTMSRKYRGNAVKRWRYKGPFFGLLLRGGPGWC